MKRQRWKDAKDEKGKRRRKRCKGNGKQGQGGITEILGKK